MSKDSVKKDIENSVNKKIDEAKKIRVIESYRDKLIKDAMQEAKERKTSAVSLFIFLILGAVLAYFFPENVTKYPVYLAVAILTLSALFYKTLFDFAGICVLFLGGFYSFIFYNANLNIEAISIFSFWASAVLFTVRLKRKFTIAVLLFTELLFTFLIYLFLK